jgi:hypothetical protein
VTLNCVTERCPREAAEHCRALATHYGTEQTCGGSSYPEQGLLRHIKVINLLYKWMLSLLIHPSILHSECLRHTCTVRQLSSRSDVITVILLMPSIGDESEYLESMFIHNMCKVKIVWLMHRRIAVVFVWSHFLCRVEGFTMEKSTGIKFRKN